MDNPRQILPARVKERKQKFDLELWIGSRRGEEAEGEDRGVVGETEEGKSITRESGRDVV